MGQSTRRITHCGQCGKSFSYRYDMGRIPEGVTNFPLSCPFCSTRQVVPLTAVRKVDLLRDGTKQEIVVLEVPENPVGVVKEGGE
ncbi:MAG: hypothetical protein KJ914_13545 [Gammaproteobacteria bacterium]|nr:hypothetical protein [Gammaproteobacteria bacterium]MBU1723788.1 hypothetical protein [Gammaproteobacteria bacterium]MBU2005449.1 hypothetical protein [Gammaproteobacteria bacterium]